MVERGTNRPPQLGNQRGFDTTNVVNFLLRREEILREKAEAGLSASAENWLNTIRANLAVMDKERDPRKVRTTIHTLTAAMTIFAGDVDYGQRGYDLSQWSEPLNTLPDIEPPGELSSLPHEVYERVGTNLYFANSFADVAANMYEENPRRDPNDYVLSLKGAKDAVFVAAIELYDAMKALLKNTS